MQVTLAFKFNGNAGYSLLANFVVAVYRLGVVKIPWIGRICTGQRRIPEKPGFGLDSATRRIDCKIRIFKHFF
jgi:hypothetical protein